MSEQNSNNEEKIIISTDDIEIRITKSKSTPEIMTLIGELIEKTKTFHEPGQKIPVLDKLETIEPKTLDERDITEDELREYSKRIPSLGEVKNYIIHKDDFRHSFRDMQMHFLDMVFNQDDSFPNQQKIYRVFYSKLYRVHDKIKKEYKGIWRDETIAPIGEPKFKVWWFEKAQ